MGYLYYKRVNSIYYGMKFNTPIILTSSLSSRQVDYKKIKSLLTEYRI